jgi:hypothetical protein
MNVKNRGRGGSSIERRMVDKAEALKEGFKLDTHILRQKMIFQLEALFDMVNQQALNCHPNQWKQKQNWTRIAGYIGQVINSLSSTYDSARIDEDLNDLATLLSNIADGKDEGVQQALAEIQAKHQTEQPAPEQKTETPPAEPEKAGS